MAGVYIHIPFCKSRCVYCGFYSTTLHEWHSRYVNALCHEMELRPLSSVGEPVSTVYLGGGTPSVLEPELLRRLFFFINKVYRPVPSCETTIECNPDDVTPELSTLLSELGVNRVSMGAQTFSDERLSFLHRRHTAGQVGTAMERLRTAGIGNVSIDLMYGFPGETLDDWQRDIRAALALRPEHLSAYALMYEEGTPLYRQWQEGRFRETDEELERTMYYTLIDQLAAAGYEHYELSNFARPGYRSRHNSSYWHDVPYIGIGAAAHSYSPRLPAGDKAACRSWNVSDVRRYTEALEHGGRPCERELLDEETHYNDTVLTALRTCEGIALDTLPAPLRSYLLQNARRYIDTNLLKMADEHLVLTRQGLFVSDMIMADLMKV